MLDTKNIETSYLNNLETPQKLSCLKALAYISQIDGHMDSSEAYILATLAKKFKLTDSRAFLQNLDEGEILDELSHISNKKAAMDLIKYLCFTAQADSDLNDKEVLFIGHAAKAMNLDVQKAAEINDFVIECLMLEEKAREIFEEE